MARVTQESLAKLGAFIDSLPEEARGKCALCNETLTHIVKMAEVETGAGTATVTRAAGQAISLYNASRRRWFAGLSQRASP